MYTDLFPNKEVAPLAGIDDGFLVVEDPADRFVVVLMGDVRHTIIGRVRGGWSLPKYAASLDDIKSVVASYFEESDGFWGEPYPSIRRLSDLP